MPNIVLMSIRSFLLAGFKYELHSYQKFDNVPLGCAVKDANATMPFREFFIHKSGSVAPFSDYFRIKLLLDNPEVVWSDTDNIFVKDDWDNDILAINQDGRIQNSILCFPDNGIGNKIRFCLNQFAENPMRMRPYDSERLKTYKIQAVRRKLETSGTSTNFRSLCDWTFSGSELYTSIFKWLKIENLAYDYSKYFNPFNYKVQRKLYMDDIGDIDLKLFKNVNILVLSTDLLRREPDIRQKLNPNSFMCNLARKYGMETI